MVAALRSESSRLNWLVYADNLYCGGVGIQAQRLCDWKLTRCPGLPVSPSEDRLQPLAQVTLLPSPW